jgi:sulfofructosephosphate aldolase
MTQPTLDTLARPGGGFAMVAMDQRESLRAMFDAAGAGRPPDDVLVRFKTDVAETLGPLASGFLIDRHYGFEQLRSDWRHPDCGLILAADSLEQAPGGPGEDTELDRAVDAGQVNLDGVSALKLLVIWRRDPRRERRVELAHRFVELARNRGVLSVLEPVVRATPDEIDSGTWEPDEAIREAARELSPLGPSLYKAQVPLSGQGSDLDLTHACELLAKSITGPWVVLSQGVHRGDFHRAVTTACRAGASGFLAGRALWSDVIGEPQVRERLRTLAVPRMSRLVESVDAHARPWSQA